MYPIQPKPQSGSKYLFESVMLKHSGKRGIIKPNDQGEYTIICGALNAHNKSGDFYPISDKIAGLFRSHPTFMRRIQTRKLIAELEHPVITPKMNEFEIITRLRKLDIEREYGTWTNIWVGEKPIKDDKGLIVYPIFGSIVASGNYPDRLRNDFENPHLNPSFSLRALSQNTTRPNGTFLRVITEPITFDRVLEGGIPTSEKYVSPTMESLNDSRIITTQDQLLAAYDGQCSITSKPSLGFNPKDVLRDFEYHKQRNDRNYLTFESDRSMEEFHQNLLQLVEDEAKALGRKAIRSWGR